MLVKKIYQSDTHEWHMFGRDPDKPEKIIDTNQYLIKTANKAILLDPGGIELFPTMLASVVRQLPISQVTHLFASHQDPDIISSLGLWDQTLENAKLYAPWLWESFIRHFGMDRIEYVPIPDPGLTLDLEGVTLEFVPAHYLHASGNYHVYDAQAKILMSGDIGAAMEPGGVPFEVSDFAEHTQYMETFHRRWMPSNRAKDDWIERVSKLDIDMMCPQHGRVFIGDDVKRFLDWFSQLEVGSGISS